VPPAVDAAPTPVPVKLVVDAPEAARASAEAALSRCGLQGPVVGVLRVRDGKVRKVSAQPQNACVTKALKRALTGAADEEPFEISIE
jgi:hypothetical protein